MLIAFLSLWIVANLLFAGLLILHRIIVPRWPQIRGQLLPIHRHNRVVHHR
jgi:hypothetical protein